MEVHNIYEIAEGRLEVKGYLFLCTDLVDLPITSPNSPRSVSLRLMHGLGYRSMNEITANFALSDPGDHYAFADMPNSDASEVVRKRKRVKTGCLTCRARKVKCDEVKPLCSNCENLNIECKWGEELGTPNSSKTPKHSRDVGHNLSSSSVKPGSRPPACLACRSARSKCSQSRPSCSRCVAYGHECKYPEPKARRSLTTSAQSWMNKFYAADQLSTPEIQEREARQSDPQKNGQVGSSYSLLSDRRRESVEVPRPSTATCETIPAESDDVSSDPSNQNRVHFLPSQLPPQSIFESPKPGPALEHEISPIQGISSPNHRPTQEQIENLAVAFFRHVHIYRANAFLHRERALSAIRDGSMPEGTVFALCAVGARFSTPREPDDVAKLWAMEACSFVMESPDKSRDNIATALLLTIYMQQRGCYTQSHLWASVAMNQAIGLELHREDPRGNHSFIECEQDRRLFYACYAMNRFISNGTPETMQCPASRIKLRLPCDGFNWRMDVGVETPYSVLETDDPHLPAWMYKNVGTMGFWVRLVGARVMIKELFQTIMETQATAASPVEKARSPGEPSIMSLATAPWNFNSPFERCMSKLASLRESLPIRLKLSRDLLRRRPGSATLDQIVMFYLWWNECHIELCSIALPGYPQSLGEDILVNAPEGWVEQVRQNCLRHAAAITDILVLLETELKTSLTIYDHTIAHAVYLSMRIQLELIDLEAGDSASRNRMSERFETMLKFVERTSAFFRPVLLVLKEMRRMLSRHGTSAGVYHDAESRPETPPLPWFRRQKNLDMERNAAQATNDAQSLEALLLELLPHSNSYGAHSWIRPDEVEMPYSQGPEWGNISAPWISGESHHSSDISGLTIADLSDLGILEPCGRLGQEAEANPKRPSSPQSIYSQDKIKRPQRFMPTLGKFSEIHLNSQNGIAESRLGLRPTGHHHGRLWKLIFKLISIRKAMEKGGDCTFPESMTYTVSTGDTINVESKPKMEPQNGLSGEPVTPNSDVSDGHNESRVDESKQSGAVETKEDSKGNQLQDQTNLLPMRQLLVVFSGLSAAMFCSMLNQTIVATALPVLGAVFHDASISSWIGTAYLLTSTSCQPLYGRLSDIFGRKICLLGSLLIFLIGSILSGVSHNMVMLIVSRAIAGIGGGGILTIVNIVVSDVVSLKERGKYQGITGVVVAIGNALGPVIGGVFTEGGSMWRWIFYINIPLSGLTMILVLFALPLRKVEGNMMEKLKKIDGWGCFISTIASIAILLPISWAGNRYAWSSAAVLVPLITGVACIAVFIWVELKVAKLPLIPMHIFKNSHVTVCIVNSFLTGFMTFVNLYYLPQFYQVARGDSPLQSGVLILPLVLSQITTSFTSGFLVSKWSCYRINLVFGFFLWTIASGLFTTVSPTTSSGRLVGYQILTGLGSGQTLQTTLVALQAAVPRKEMAVVTGARNFLRMMGSTLAVAASAAIINNIVQSNLESRNFTQANITEITSDPTKINTMYISSSQKQQALSAYAQGVSVTYYIMTALAGIQFLLCVFFIEDYSLKRDDDEKQKQEAKERLKERRKIKNGSRDMVTGRETMAADNDARLELQEKV